jgi:hypothetical protein
MGPIEAYYISCSVTLWFTRNNGNNSWVVCIVTAVIGKCNRAYTLLCCRFTGHTNVLCVRLFTSLIRHARVRLEQKSDLICIGYIPAAIDFLIRSSFSIICSGICSFFWHNNYCDPFLNSSVITVILNFYSVESSCEKLGKSQRILKSIITAHYHTGNLLESCSNWP